MDQGRATPAAGSCCRAHGVTSGGTPQRRHESGCCEVVEYSLSTDTDPEGVFQSLFGKDP